MANYLQYWKDYDSVSERGTVPPFSASSQFPRKKIEVGDWLWLVTMRSQRLTLLGNFQIAEFIDEIEAEERFGFGVRVATRYAIPTKGTKALDEIDINDVARLLRFGKDCAALSIQSDNVVDGKQLQSIRQLSPDSVSLLLQVLGQDAPTPKAQDFVDPEMDGEDSPARRLVQTYRILRDTKLAREVK